jgi:hypothetical protein
MTLVHADFFFCFQRRGVGLLPPLPTLMDPRLSILPSQNPIWIFWFVLKSHASLCVCKSHSWVSLSHSYCVEFTLVSVVITFVHVKITLCIWKSDSACINKTQCVSWVSQLNLCVSKSHSACRNLTMRVEIALCVWISHSACGNRNKCIYITLCVWSSHYACDHPTMRMIIPLVYVVEITLVRVKITLCVLQITFFFSSPLPWIRYQGLSCHWFFYEYGLIPFCPDCRQFYIL